ncbi:MAG: hypothetical protein ACR2K6_02940 [Solirubrobacterales bacterium]
MAPTLTAPPESSDCERVLRRGPSTRGRSIDRRALAVAMGMVDPLTIRRAGEVESSLARMYALSPDPSAPPQVSWGPEGSCEQEQVSVTEADGRRTITYRLCHQSSGSRFGRGSWLERVSLVGGGVGWRGVPASEPLAVLVEVDPIAALRVFRLTAEVALELWGSSKITDRHKALRIRDWLRDGVRRDRIGLRRIQLELVRLVSGGTPISDICGRARLRLDDPSDRGMMVPGKGGEPDRASTTWLLRRAGLQDEVCPRTGKVRISRTASYEMGVRLARAADIDPRELGL